MRTTLLSLAILSIQFLPVQALGASTCFVSGQDTVAGLGTEIIMRGCNASQSIDISILGPGNSSYQQKIVTDANGNAMTLVPSKVTMRAGTYTVHALSQQSQFSVLPDTPDDTHSQLIASPNSIPDDQQSLVTVTAILRDKFDNPIVGRPIALISSRTTDEIRAKSGQTDEQGRFIWSVHPLENGIMTLTTFDVIGGKQMKMRAQVTIGERTSFLSAAIGGDRTVLAQDPSAFSPTSLSADAGLNASVDHFEVFLPNNATSVKANELFSMTIRAMRGTSIVRGYIGTLIVTTSDPDAELPKKGDDPKNPMAGRIDVRNIDQGERKVPLAFVLRNKGTQTITITDLLDPTIQGTIILNVERDEASLKGKMMIIDPPDRSKIKGGNFVTIQGKAPSLINISVKGGASTVEGESDAEGVFRINVPLDPENREVTLFAESENGTYESEPVHLFIDNEPPTIETISIDPSEGKTTETAIVRVQSEAKLTSVTATILNQVSVLTESGAGMYIGLITAPNTEGQYDVSVNIKDALDQESTTLMKWTVKPKKVPRVEGVEAKAHANQVALTWTPIHSIPIAQYKIYVSTESDPNNYLYSLETKSSTSSATLKDLPVGKTYLFSLTAINEDGDESPEKSDPAKAESIGLQVSAIPGKASVLLTWVPIPDLPLLQYTVEYGTDITTLNEKRIINGQATSATMHDLLPGIRYLFRLTPIALGGKTIKDLETTVEATPTGSGFVLGAYEAAPTELLQKNTTPPSSLHGGAPNYPPTIVRTSIQSGVSSFVLLVTLLTGFIATFLWIQHRRMQQKTLAFLVAMKKNI